MALLYIDVPNPDELLVLYGAAAVIRWEYSADGSSGWAEGGTETIVAATYRYVIEHLTDTSYYYRTRYSKASPSVAADYSGYGDVFQVDALQAYATVAEARRALPGIASDAHDYILSDLLVDVSALVDVRTFRKFVRIPQVSGTETFYLDVNHSGQRRLVEAVGHGYCTDGEALDIISVTSVHVRDSETSDYAEVAAGVTGYRLLAGPAIGEGRVGTDWPYEDIELYRSATRTTWPVGDEAVKIVGVRGFPSVPHTVSRAVLGEVSERFRQRIGSGPSQMGVNAFGQPIFLTGDSPEMRRLLSPPFVKRMYTAATI